MRRSLIAWTLALAAIVFAALGVQPTLAATAAEQPPARAALGDLVAPDASGRRPSQAAWSPDGTRLAYIWDEKGDGSEKSLWSLDIATGKREALLRPADLGEDKKDEKDSKDKKTEIEEYSWSPKGDALLVLAGGDLYLESLPGHGVRRLTQTKVAEEDPHFSPDGRRIAFVRSFDLYVLDMASGAETRLTPDGQENVALNGTNDWVYGEEIWNRQPEGFWWSPDSSRIAFLHFDEAPVGVYSLVDDTPLYPKVTPQKYPKSGEPNPRVKVGVMEVASGKTTWLGTADGSNTDSYPARVDWTPKSDAVAVQRLSRDQKHLDLLRCGAADGACSSLINESWRTWINLGKDFHFLPDGRFLWGSERDGWRRLYLYGADGRSVHPVTPEGWAVTALDGVADDGTWALVTVFSTPELGAIDRKVARISLKAGGGWEILTPKPGSNSAVVSTRTGSWVHTWSDADTPTRSTVRPAGGGKPIALPSADPKFDAASLPKWEIFTIPGPDGSRLPARLLKPAGFDPSHRYPAIIYHYGGPGSQVVDNAWNVRSLWHKLMAQRGFVVFSVDNQSSTFFGKAGEDRDYRRFGTINLAGQLAGVDYLKTLPWVDASRLGLWGWSGGGSNTLYCVLNRPGVWKAAIAGAPVTDWRLYDSIWTERYLDRPQDNADGYRDSSPITYTANLKDHLLVVHGLADDNVHPQNSINLSGDFIKAGVSFEQAFYPGQKHGFRGASSRHFYERATEFFERELAP
jgi:dipeptidyl-peptidase-4